MKHLLRAMGAAMLAALLLSACSTPQEQTEPSAPQTTQATQAATGATEESATEAEELLALPRDLGSGLTLQAVLPFPARMWMQTARRATSLPPSSCRTTAAWPSARRISP